jgi:hypothetical protein
MDCEPVLPLKIFSKLWTTQRLAINCDSSCDEDGNSRFRIRESSSRRSPDRRSEDLALFKTLVNQGKYPKTFLGYAGRKREGDVTTSSHHIYDGYLRPMIHRDWNCG